MSEDPVGSEKGFNIEDAARGVVKSELVQSAKEIAQETVVDPLKRAGEITKESLISSKDALLASGKVLTKNIQEFANNLGIHLFEQGSASKRDRIAGTASALALSGFTSSLFLPIASAVLRGPAAGTPEAYAIAGLLTLPTSLPLIEAYKYAMGRKRL